MKNFIMILAVSFILAGSGNIAVSSPGSFYVVNQTACTVQARVYAYLGGCTSVDCPSGPQGNTGWVSVPAHQTVDIASGYGGSGDVWAYVEAQWSTHPVISTGDASCFSQGSPSECGPDAVGRNIYWDSCNQANIH